MRVNNWLLLYLIFSLHDCDVQSIVIVLQRFVKESTCYFLSVYSDVHIGVWTISNAPALTYFWFHWPRVCSLTELQDQHAHFLRPVSLLVYLDEILIAIIGHYWKSKDFHYVILNHEFLWMSIDMHRLPWSISAGYFSTYQTVYQEFSHVHGLIWPFLLVHVIAFYYPFNGF